MADDTVPQDDPRALTDEERLMLASDWSDYRKDYGVSADDKTRQREHQLFKAGWHRGRVSNSQTVPDEAAQTGDQMWITFPVSGDDEELRVIQVVAQVIEGLDEESARARVLRWASDRFAPSSPSSGEGE